MWPHTSLALCSALLASTTIAAQSTTTTASSALPAPSVISVFLLDAAPQHALVGSIIHSDASRTTMAVTCATSECGYPSTVTATFGPSTFAATLPYIKLTADIHCSIYGSTASASCTETITGPANDVGVTTGSVTESGATSITTRTTSSVLTGSKMSYFPVTVTAGAGVGESSSETKSSSASASASTTAASAAGSASGTGSAAAASGSNAAVQLGVGPVGGVAAVGLMGWLVAAL